MIILIICCCIGTPTGICDNFKIDTNCNSNNSMSVVSKLCLNQNKCVISVDNHEFGGDPCNGTHKYLDVQVECSNQSKEYLEIDVVIPSGSISNVYLRRTSKMINIPINQWIVVESGVTIWKDMKFSNTDKGVINGEIIGNDALMFTTQSGSYSFELHA